MADGASIDHVPGISEMAAAVALKDVSGVSNILVPITSFELHGNNSRIGIRSEIFRDLKLRNLFVSEDQRRVVQCRRDHVNAVTEDGVALTECRRQPVRNILPRQ